MKATRNDVLRNGNCHLGHPPKLCYILLQSFAFAPFQRHCSISMAALVRLMRSLAHKQGPGLKGLLCFVSTVRARSQELAMRMRGWRVAHFQLNSLLSVHAPTVHRQDGAPSGPDNACSTSASKAPCGSGSDAARVGLRACPPLACVQHHTDQLSCCALSSRRAMPLSPSRRTRGTHGTAAAGSTCWWPAAAASAQQRGSRAGGAPSSTAKGNAHSSWCHCKHSASLPHPGRLMLLSA